MITKGLQRPLLRPFTVATRVYTTKCPMCTRLGAIHPVGVIQYNELKGKGLQRCNPFFINQSV